MKHTKFIQSGIQKEDLQHVKGGYGAPEKVCPRCGGTTWFTNGPNRPEDPIYIMKCTKCGLVIHPVIN